MISGESDISYLTCNCLCQYTKDVISSGSRMWHAVKVLFCTCIKMMCYPLLPPQVQFFINYGLLQAESLSAFVFKPKILVFVLEILAIKTKSDIFLRPLIFCQ